MKLLVSIHVTGTIAEALEAPEHDTRQTSKSTLPVQLDAADIDAIPLESVAIALQPAPLLVPGLVPVPADTPRAQRRALLLSAVPWDTNTPGGISPADIRRATGISKIDATNDLDELRKHGQVIKVAPGRYARPGPAPVTKEK